MDAENTFLNQITTRWPLISDPVQFVIRYATAIRRYLSAMIRDQHDLEDVIQDFLLRTVERGLITEEMVHGRFRDYLKTSVRNAALAHLRKRKKTIATEAELAGLQSPSEIEIADREWVAEWRGTMLDQALEKLEDHEAHAPDGRLYTVLTIARDNPHTDSPTLAKMVSEASGRSMSPEAFRKQLSRARTLLANLLVDEVRRTLENPTAEKIEDELADLGLQELVNPYRE